ncbi:MAG: transcriptional repressor [bacterium]|nr:transcriptional repressor [bacterium]
MTTARRKRDELVDWVVQECRRRNLKLTHQRLEIYRELVTGSGHPSAEELYRRLKPRMPTLALDTVYRTLLTFENHGLIARVEALDDRARFETNLSVHHHLVCTQCRRPFDFYWPDIDQLKLPDEISSWGQVTSRHLELRGTCRHCLATPAVEP